MSSKTIYRASFKTLRGVFLGMLRLRQNWCTMIYNYEISSENHCLLCTAVIFKSNIKCLFVNLIWGMITKKIAYIYIYIVNRILFVPNIGIGTKNSVSARQDYLFPLKKHHNNKEIWKHFIANTTGITLVHLKLTWRANVESVCALAVCEKVCPCRSCITIYTIDVLLMYVFLAFLNFIFLLGAPMKKRENVYHWCTLFNYIYCISSII